MRELIGLSGYARSGKDEAAKVLVEEFGFVRVAFADKLRDVLYALNPIVDVEYHVKDEDFLRRYPVMVRHVQEVIDTFGWDGYKETAYYPEIRRLLQRLGTEAGRQTMWDSIWVDAALSGLPEDAKVVVTDVRFPNEADAVGERGGDMWRITREGVGPTLSADGTAHISETALDEHEFDLHITNNHTLEAFHDTIKKAYEDY